MIVGSRTSERHREPADRRQMPSPLGYAAKHRRIGLHDPTITVLTGKQAVKPGETPGMCRETGVGETVPMTGISGVG